MDVFVVLFSITVVFFYVFLRLVSHSNLYQSAKSIEHVNSNLIKNFTGLILLVDKDYLIQGMKIFKKVYKKMKKIEKESLIITYDPKLFNNQSDVEVFKSLDVSYVPCIVKLDSHKDKKHTAYKVEEFLT